MTEPTAEDRGAILTSVFGHMAAQTLAATVRLGVADHLGDAERTATDLAADAGTDPQATERLLRAAAAMGLASEVRPGTFALSPRGSLLRTDRPDSVADFVAMFLDPVMIAAWGHLDDSVRTGRTSFDEVFGVDFFSHLAAHPEMSRQFNASMRQATRGTAAELPGAVDFSASSAVTDVGGGDGTLLAAILVAHPHLRGVLFDTAVGSAEAGPVLGEAGVADRCEVVTGDFFASAPPGSDTYLLKSIVHDWDDERVVAILSRVRAVIPDDGRLLVVEPVLPDTVDGSMRPGIYLSDLNMLVNVGGRERTEGEFRTLCARAGFTVTDVTVLSLAAGRFSVIDARPA